MLAGHLAVVGDVGDDGVLVQAVALERVEQRADPLVGEGDQAVVGGAAAADLLLGGVVESEVLAQALALRVLGVEVAGDVRQVGVAG